VPHLNLLRVLLVLGIASTTIHYAHNFIMAGMYPPVPVVFPNDLSYRIGIAIFWPLLTFNALRGYARYVKGEMRKAAWDFISYAPLGMTTIGHFLGGNPEIPAFFYVTIFTDFLTGTAMLIFGIATLRSNPHT
jgi:hypothetical protein